MADTDHEVRLIMNGWLAIFWEMAPKCPQVLMASTDVQQPSKHPLPCSGLPEVSLDIIAFTLYWGASFGVLEFDQTSNL